MKMQYATVSGQEDWNNVFGEMSSIERKNWWIK